MYLVYRDVWIKFLYVFPPFKKKKKLITHPHPSQFQKYNGIITTNSHQKPYNNLVVVVGLDFEDPAIILIDSGISALLASSTLCGILGSWGPKKEKHPL